LLLWLYELLLALVVLPHAWAWFLLDDDAVVLDELGLHWLDGFAAADAVLVHFVAGGHL
jgi:hypothetical protein